MITFLRKLLCEKRKVFNDPLVDLDEAAVRVLRAFAEKHLFEPIDEKLLGAFRNWISPDAVLEAIPKEDFLKNPKCGIFYDREKCITTFRIGFSTFIIKPQSLSDGKETRNGNLSNSKQSG